jgi:hypothetical protein
MDYANNIKTIKANIISTFSDIDTKINNLHQRSTVDFLQLNEYLKDYHKKTRIISENAFRVIDTIAGNRDMDLIEELGKIHHRLEECMIKIKEENLRKIQVLKELLTKSNHLNISLRNYKQDFTTFKFLATNFSLLSNYEDFGSSWKENLEKWNAEILSIQQALTSVYSNVGSYKEQITINIAQLELKVEKSLKSLNTLSKVIKDNISSVIQKSHESKMQFPLLKEKTVDSSRSISNIITHLQYHDIIRQKIEHIQKAHYKIIDDLKKSGKNKGTEEENIREDYYRIGDITDLQAAQLLLVSKEFQNAIDVITKNFQGIAKDITTISHISSEFSYKDNHSEITLLRQIKNQLDEGIVLLDLNDFREINREYIEASKKIDEISVQLALQIQGPLRKLARFENLKSDSFGDIENRPGVVTQILLLTADMELKNNDICENLNEIQVLSETVLSSDELDSLGSQLEQDRINLMVEITKILSALDRDNEELDNVLSQNRSLNNNIVEKIENVINKVDYYDYFETIVENVISQLNDINNSIKPGSGSDIKGNREANLTEVRTNYTMESERIVHDQVVTGMEDKEIQAPQTAEDEIEFF